MYRGSMCICVIIIMICCIEYPSRFKKTDSRQILRLYIKYKTWKTNQLFINIYIVHYKTRKSFFAPAMVIFSFIVYHFYYKKKNIFNNICMIISIRVTFLLSIIITFFLFFVYSVLANGVQSPFSWIHYVYCFSQGNHLVAIIKVQFSLSKLFEFNFLFYFCIEIYWKQNCNKYFILKSLSNEKIVYRSWQSNDFYKNVCLDEKEDSHLYTNVNCETISSLQRFLN